MRDKIWFAGKRAFLVRDMVRDYCLVYKGLASQRARFAGDCTLSFATLRDLLGSERQKGVFWRLKDNTHLFFRHGLHHADMQEAPLPQAGGDDAESSGLLLDWCVGHAFHECWKLMEDAYQRSHYGCYLTQLVAATAEPALTEPLTRIAGQTIESSRRELERIFHVLDHGLTLLARFLAGEAGNGHLARFFACEEDLAREVFGPAFDALLTNLYGAPIRVYALAASDLAGVGRHREATALLRRVEPLLDAGGTALLAELSSEQDSLR